MITHSRGSAARSAASAAATWRCVPRLDRHPHPVVGPFVEARVAADLHRRVGGRHRGQRGGEALLAHREVDHRQPERIATEQRRHLVELVAEEAGRTGQHHHVLHRRGRVLRVAQQPRPLRHVGHPQGHLGRLGAGVVAPVDGPDGRLQRGEPHQRPPQRRRHRRHGDVVVGRAHSTRGEDPAGPVRARRPAPPRSPRSGRPPRGWPGAAPPAPAAAAPPRGRSRPAPWRRGSRSRPPPGPRSPRSPELLHLRAGPPPPPPRPALAVQLHDPLPGQAQLRDGPVVARAPPFAGRRPPRRSRGRGWPPAGAGRPPPAAPAGTGSRPATAARPLMASTQADVAGGEPLVGERGEREAIGDRRPRPRRSLGATSPRPRGRAGRPRRAAPARRRRSGRRPGRPPAGSGSAGRAPRPARADGSAVTCTRRPPRRSASPRSRACVVVPAPSSPSSTMKPASAPPCRPAPPPAGHRSSSSFRRSSCSREKRAASSRPSACGGPACTRTGRPGGPPPGRQSPSSRPEPGRDGPAPAPRAPWRSGPRGRPS